MTTLQLVSNRSRLYWNRLLLFAFGAVVVAAAIGVGGWQLWRYQQYQRQLAASQAPAVADVTRMNISSFAYAAPHIQVRAGETITWTNTDEAEHDVTLNNGAATSGELITGASWSYAFAEPGVYNYVCGAHPFMVGRVTVN